MNEFEKDTNLENEGAKADNDFNIEYTDAPEDAHGEEHTDNSYSYNWTPYEYSKENVYTPDYMQGGADSGKEKCGKKKKGNFSRYVAAVLCGMFAGAVIFGGALKFAGYGTRYDNSAVEQKSGSASTVGTDGVTSSGMNTVDIVKKAGPAVVGITTVSTTMSFWGQQESQGSGSGFIIKENGYIVTNQHVIDGAKKITVRLSNGDEYDASLIGADSKTDLAVIKIDVTGLPTVEIGKSAELEVGELAVAIGNPLGTEFAGSVTQGCISALNRTMSVEGRQYNLIQTDAAINPGNSGGPLINKYGQVIGINSVKITMEGYEGMGFAIPIDDAMPIINELLTGQGYIKGRPLIGIATRDITEMMAKQYNLPIGVYVVEVSSFSAAEKAGIHSGDVIVKADGQPVTNKTELDKIKSNHKAGENMTLDLVRNGQNISVTVTLDEEKPSSTN